MEFGKVETPDLNEIDFTLPPDAPGTMELLKKRNLTNIKPEIFVGCAKWGRKDWVGKIYPQGTKEADFLSIMQNILIALSSMQLFIAFQR